MIAATDLTGLNPIETFQNLVTTGFDADGTSSIYNATGSRISSLNVTASFAKSASYEIIYESSSSWADFAQSASHAQSSLVTLTSSYIYPSAGVVSTAPVPTGSSAGTAGFTSIVELGQFILDVSSSVVLLNDLIDKLKSKGIIS